MPSATRTVLSTLLFATACVSGSILRPWYGDRAIEPRLTSVASDTIEIETGQPVYAALVSFSPDGGRSAMVAEGFATRHRFPSPSGETDAEAAHRGSHMSDASFPRASRSTCGWVNEPDGVDANGRIVYRRVPRCVETPSPQPGPLTGRAGGPPAPYAIAVTSELPIDGELLNAVAETIDPHASPYQAASAIARSLFPDAQAPWSLAVVR